jgi:hypothetical protein
MGALKSHVKPSKMEESKVNGREFNAIGKRWIECGVRRGVDGGYERVDRDAGGLVGWRGAGDAWGWSPGMGESRRMWAAHMRIQTILDRLARVQHSKHLPDMGGRSRRTRRSCCLKAGFGQSRDTQKAVVAKVAQDGPEKHESTAVHRMRQKRPVVAGDMSSKGGSLQRASSGWREGKSGVVT